MGSDRKRERSLKSLPKKEKGIKKECEGKGAEHEEPQILTQKSFLHPTFPKSHLL